MTLDRSSPAQKVLALTFLTLVSQGVPALGQGEDPNLLIVQVAMTPGLPVGGDEVTFDVTVRSGASNSSHFNVSFLVDNASVAKVHSAEVYGGIAVHVVSPPWVAQPGRHTLRIILDPEDRIAESNERDNEALRTFTVGPMPDRPDLVPLSIGLAPGNPHPGEVVEIVVRVGNEGAADAGPFNVSVRAEGYTLPPEEMEGLTAGAEMTFSRNVIMNRSVAVEVVVDAGSSVMELNESNNRRTLGSAGGRADLVVAEFNADPATPQPGAPLMLFARVKNQGSVAAGPFRVAFLGNGNVLGSQEVASLAAGATSRDLRVEAVTPARASIVRVVADVDDDVDEENEANNVQSVTVSPLPPGGQPPPPAGAAKPDLLVTSWSPPGQREGDTGPFTATIQNMGGGPAGATSVLFAVDGRALGATRLAGLAAGVSATVNSLGLWKATQGAHSVRVTVDSGKTVAEANEANNEVTGTLNIGPAVPLELNVTNLQLLPPDPQAGTQVSFGAEITVLGLPAGASIAISFVVDSHPLGTRSVTPTPGQWALTLTSPPWTMTPGAHIVTVGVVAPGEEANQENNFRSLRFGEGAPDGSGGSGGTGATGAATPQPDLVVLSVAPSDPNASPGSTVSLVAIVANRGPVDAPPFGVGFQVDGGPLVAAGSPGIPPGGQVNVTLAAWQMLEGSHTLRAVADPAGAVPELREDNNAYDASVTSASAGKPIRVPGPDALLVVGTVAGVALAVARRPRRP